MIYLQSNQVRTLSMKQKQEQAENNVPNLMVVSSSKNQSRKKQLKSGAREEE
jgi:hypothetical protein